MGLKQLTSPPISARKFADWVLSDFYNPQTQLGSVELLLSEHSPTPYRLPDGSLIEIEAAIIANVEAAFHRWYAHCDTHAENIALFYFCGHGVIIQGDHILLAEDYGANSFMPFRSTVDFNRLYRGMARNKAKCQCYFIDACSNVPVDGLELRDIGAQHFVQTTLTQPEPPALVLKASVPGDRAYAEIGGVSRFTQALLHCFKGIGSEPEQAQWVVTSTLLVDRVIRAVEMLNQLQGGERQRPRHEGNMERRLLHVHQKPPTIPLSIRFHPLHAIQEAELALQSFPHCTWQQQGSTSVDNWTLEQVEVGLYKLQARFQTGNYQELDELLWVFPPGPWPYPDPILCKERL